MREEQPKPFTNEHVELKEEESELTQLLGKVNLEDPLEIPDHSGKLVIVPKDKFIMYYLPKGTSQEDAFHCMQAVRATGLSIFAPGECYFFPTGDGPVKLHTGYLAYVRKAYAAGLEHIETPEVIFPEGGEDSDGYPYMCNITIRIKGRESMTWPTYFAEVASTTRNNELNSRWRKAPIQMLIKCAIVNILRLSGLVDFTMPPTVAEVGDRVEPGHKTLTAQELGTDTEVLSMEIEEQATEQSSDPDTGEEYRDPHNEYREFQKFYFAALGARDFLSDTEDRRIWQEMTTGVASSKNWGAGERKLAMDALKDIPLVDSEPESEKDLADLPPKQTFLAEGEKHFASIDDLEKWCREKVSETSWDTWTDGNFEVALTALVRLPLLDAEKPEDNAGQIGVSALESIFVMEASTRFATPEDRDAWIAMWTSKPRSEWSVSEYAVGTQRLTKLAEIHPGQGDTTPEPEDKPSTKATRKILSNTVNTFPDKLYKTVRSVAFRVRAKMDVGRSVTTIEHYTECECLAIIESLEAEKEALNTTEPESEPASGLDKIDEHFEGEGERAEAHKVLLDLYRDRLFRHYKISGGKAFASIQDQTDKQREWTGSHKPADWGAAEFALANAGLDSLGVWSPGDPFPEAVLADNKVEEIKALLAELLPDSTDKDGVNVGYASTKGREIITGITRAPYPGSLKDFSDDTKDDIIHGLKDKITDGKQSKAESEERKKNSDNDDMWGGGIRE